MLIYSALLRLTVSCLTHSPWWMSITAFLQPGKAAQSEETLFSFLKWGKNWNSSGSEGVLLVFNPSLWQNFLSSHTQASMRRDKSFLKSYVIGGLRAQKQGAAGQATSRVALLLDFPVKCWRSSTSSAASSAAPLCAMLWASQANNMETLVKQNGDRNQWLFT